MKKIILLIMLSISLGLSSCTVDNITTIGAEMKKISIGETLNHGFESYTSESGVEVTYSSSHENILDDQGFFHNPPIDTEIEVFVKFVHDGKEDQKTFLTTALAAPNKNIEIARDYVSTVIPNTISNDLDFKKQKYGDIKISYTPLNLDVIDAEGKIKQLYVSQETQILISYTDDKIKVIYSEVITVTVKGHSNLQLSIVVNDWLKTQVDLLVEGEIDILPTTHPEYDISISWFSQTIGFVSNDGKVNKPIKFQGVELIVTIVNGSLSTSFTHKIESIGGNTYENYLEKWLSQIIPTKINGVVNHVYKQYPSDDGLYLDYQEVVNYNGVLNLLNGQNPLIDDSYYIDTTDTSSFKNKLFTSVTSSKLGQDVLDRLFYPGYQMPNDNNILWIVVHESGMPLVGQNAELLAKIQWNNAFITTEPRVASWHYQVDENKIYQSFDDNVHAWHAGGSLTNLPYGNSNSIGIEMCINADGNYEGSMRNNAKLIAHLMHKYNLKIENIKRHYDFSFKECPSYMMRTNRWNEFLGLVMVEYQAMELLVGAAITWSIDSVLLNTYFVKGDNNLYYNVAVENIVDIPISVKVERNGQIFEVSDILKLYPGA